jgi:uroporphyrinogen-III synthase
MGLAPVVAPVLRITPLPARLPAPNQIAAIVVPSGNALPALAAFVGTKILAVGDATARRAEAAGFTSVHSAGRDAKALAALAQRMVSPAEGVLLLVAGKGQSLALAADLRRCGYRVLRRAVYAAIPVPALPEPAVVALREYALRAALFFSGETARHFVRLTQAAGLAGQCRSVSAVAIGLPAAVALGALPWRRVDVAANPNQDEMLALLR